MENASEKRVVTVLVLDNKETITLCYTESYEQEVWREISEAIERGGLWLADCQALEDANEDLNANYGSQKLRYINMNRIVGIE